VSRKSQPCISQTALESPESPLYTARPTLEMYSRELQGGRWGGDGLAIEDDLLAGRISLKVSML
jgi:hypothetical protein